MKRSAGILLPLSALPGKYGIGSLGSEARKFANFLQSAGQSWWQLLPVGTTDNCNSPYTSASTFAGNYLYIDLEELNEKGFISKKELETAVLPASNKVPYDVLKKSRLELLRRAYQKASASQTEMAAVRAFSEATPWLREYALFQAARLHFDELPWYDWPDEGLRNHNREAMEQWRAKLAEEVVFQTCLQYWFFTQWQSFKTYVNSLGVKLIGDLPFYVSLDSVDVWSERRQFLLDSSGHPTKVAGVPPDYFSENGQLWGNPLYDWKVHQSDGFGWWIRRVEGATKLYDAIRIDHFRGMESYWAVPATSATAKNGEWCKGPGMTLLNVLINWFHQTNFIAEDLGLLTDEVHRLREEAKLPGMKVLEFAFSGPDNAYLPHHYIRNCICYTGTHDNDTLAGWYEHTTEQDRIFIHRYLGVENATAVCNAVLRLGQGSVADLFMVQMQDYLGLGSEARMNVPGVADGNWAWRLLPGQATDKLAEEIRDLTRTFDR